MPWWSAERRNVPIARDVGRLESVQACVSARIRVPRTHPSAISALRSPSLGREGKVKDGAAGVAKTNGRRSIACLIAMKEVHASIRGRGRISGRTIMTDHTQLSRRALMRGTAAFGALALSGRIVSGPAMAAPATRLPARGNFVIRNAYVMPMEPGTGDLANGDVHVRDGAIVAGGTKLSAPGAAVVDGAGIIVLPGLVETHWHMWNTLLRSMSGEKPEHGYFRTTAALGQKCEPGDMYQGTRLAAAEAINSGITFVHDWCHNIRGFDYAEADLRALRETGIRARFSYGGAQGMANSASINVGDFERLHREWASYGNDGLIKLGLAWRGMGGNNPASAIPPEIYRREIEAARNLGLPVSVHASGSRPAAGQGNTISE